MKLTKLALELKSLLLVVVTLTCVDSFTSRSTPISGSGSGSGSGTAFQRRHTPFSLPTLSTDTTTTTRTVNVQSSRNLQLHLFRNLFRKGSDNDDENKDEKTNNDDPVVVVEAVKTDDNDDNDNDAAAKNTGEKKVPFFATTIDTTDSVAIDTNEEKKETISTTTTSTTISSKSYAVEAPLMKEEEPASQPLPTPTPTPEPMSVSVSDEPIPVEPVPEPVVVEKVVPVAVEEVAPPTPTTPVVEPAVVEPVPVPAPAPAVVEPVTAVVEPILVEPITAVKVEETSTVTVPVPTPVEETPTELTPKVEMSALEKAKALRAQAERTRLEAEKMDIVLTLQKIENLEAELKASTEKAAVAATTKETTKETAEGNSVDDEKAIKAKEKKLKQEKEREGEVRKQIQALKKKLNGDTTSTTNKDGQQQSTIITSVPTEKKSVDTIITSVFEELEKSNKDNQKEKKLTTEEIEQRVEAFNKAPSFMKELVANAAGMSMPTSTTTDVEGEKAETFNTTALILKMEQDQIIYNKMDGNYNTNQRTVENMPEFTNEQIEEVMEAVKMVPKFVKNMYGDEIKNNDTAIALLMLEDEWKQGKIVEMPEITQQMIDNKLEEVKWVPQFLRGDNETDLALELIKMDFKNNPQKFRSEVMGSSSTSEDASRGIMGAPTDMTTSDGDSSKKGFFSSGLFGGGSSSENAEEELSDIDKMVESLFPQSARREGEGPTEKDIQQAMVDIFAKDKTWSVSEKPEKVIEGYIVRGVTKYETGKELIDAIDKNLEKSNLKDKLSVFYVFDPTPVTEEQMGGGDRPPVLYVTGPKVVRDAAPFQRSIISSLALGTVWYNSLIPYLLNEKYMKLADEQLALADASMTANLDFLNDLSFPLFASLLGIQVAHEVAHVVVAKVNGLETSFPTLVPSLESGLTGAITSLQAPPKDKQALFDFAIAGPLTGIACSVALMYAGMFITSSMDAASFSNLPYLPLDLLRQSSLAGGIIDSVSPGLLSVPDAALGTQALNDINIPLHPFTIAGYFGLLINAINLLPVGRTDGGRISLTLFGRSGTQLVSLIAFVGLFFGGLVGSDLLLFFFSFVIFFQSELEIPQRNEVDDMDFSRVLLATATGCLVLLTLIPM